MLTASKKKKLLMSLKAFQKKYFAKKLGDLDESGTRLLINDLLCMCLDYIPLEEVKTEYMIRGTYADYMVQIKGNRHFLVEVKALSLSLSDKHLRQVLEYGANEGVDWAVLTNGKEIHLYRIIFDKPIDAKLIFKIDIGDKTLIKEAVDKLQYLHRDSVTRKGLDLLWNRFTALEGYTIAGLLFDNSIINILRRSLKRKFKSKFDPDEIKDALTEVICSEVDMEKVKISTGPRKHKVHAKAIAVTPALEIPIASNTSLN